VTSSPPSRPALEKGARLGPYEVLSLLGAGGMGEVYRARDSRLGREVAVKVLPADLCRDLDRRRRFEQEARAVGLLNHPNLLAVFDVGEREGASYLVFELLEGETLRARLGPGPLPASKAIDFAIQIARGLAAAHEKGITHRDLKPENLFVTHDGRVKILDFGLAKLRYEPEKDGGAAPGPAGVTETATVVGTRGYMSPEQVRARPADHRSDIFSFGAVLYEMLAGTPAFQRGSDFDTSSAILNEDPPALSRAQPPGLERILRRCLEKNPAERFRSAHDLAFALEAVSGSPAAPLPGPGALAAAGPTGELRPAVTWALFGLAAAGAFVIAAFIGKSTQITLAAIPKPPEALAERARQILDSVGHTGTRRDSEYWFRAELAGGPDAPSNAQLRGIRFVYRQSPAYLVPQNLFRFVTETDPPANVPGMASVTTDAAGLLLRFESVPAPGRTSSLNAVPDWAALFTAAGLSLTDFAEVETDRTAPVPFDQQRGWTRQGGAAPVVVAAASLNGKAVYFEKVLESPVHHVERTPWSRGSSTLAERLEWIAIVLGFCVSAILARDSLRRGEGDRRGARRLSVFVTLGGVLHLLLRAHHVPMGIEEAAFLLSITGWALVWAAFTWLIYIGVEPHVRRLWPGMLLSWTRLVGGRTSDPLVGRDVLIGTAGSVAVVAVRFLFGDEPAPNVHLASALESIRSIRQLGNMIAFHTLDNLQFSFAVLLFLLLVRRIVRRTWLAAILLSALFLPMVTERGWQVSWGGTVYLAAWFGALAVLVGFGLLAFTTMGLVFRLLTGFPLTLDTDAWYFGSSATILILTVALAAYGCLVSLSDHFRKP
jgi:hypothetical protein